MKKPKRFSGSLALIPILLSMTFFNTFFWLNYAYGEGSPPVIGYTTQQMSVNGTQTLSAVGGDGCTFGWAIASGGGSLSASSGSSTVYRAPATNPNCVNNPLITLSCGGIVIASLPIAVNAAVGGGGVAYYTCCNGHKGTYPYDFYCFNYVNCAETVYGFSTGSDCLASCGANSGSFGTGGNGTCSIFGFVGVQDARTDAMKAAGCCPAKFISPCQMHITSFGANVSTINLSSGQGAVISGGINGNPGGVTNWTVSVTGTGWVKSGSGEVVSATWNGRGPSGKEVPPGNYSIVLSVQTEGGQCNGNTIQQTIPIQVTANPQQCLLVEGGSLVNAASGNLSHSQTLFRFPNAKFKGEFVLSYNSFDGQLIPLGLGWTHSYHIRLLFNNDGSYTLIEGDGQKTALYNNGSRYTPQKSPYPALTKYSDNSYTLEYRDGLIYHFNAGKIITSITDRNSNTLTFSYDSGNKLTGLVDSSGRSTVLQYDSNNRINLITDPMGNSHTFTYTDRLLTAVSSQINGLGIQKWAYIYDENGFMLTRTDPGGYGTSYVYDSDHRLIRSIDPQGKTRTMAYNPSQSLTQITEKDGGLWTYTYDAVIGALIGKTDSLGNTSQYFYDSQWNLSVVTDPKGNGTWYTYDASGNTTSMTDSLGYTTSYTYNAQNKITGIVYPGNAGAAFTYDAKGNLTSLTDSTGSLTRYGYDAMGNLISITNALNQVTSLAYNQNNYLTSLTAPTTAITSFNYDSAGNLLTQIDPLNNTIGFQYNGLNKIIRITDPLGQVTDFGYDLNGNLISKTDGNNNVTQYQYNYKGQVLQVTDALNQSTRFTYGAGCGSCGSGDERLTTLIDARGKTTSFEYNLAGKLIRETNPLGDVKTYTYDGAGNRISMTDETNNTTLYSYDQLNRLTQVLYPDGTTKALGYDARGNMISAANPHIGYALTYDLNNRLTGVLDSNGKAVSYQYDALNNRSQMTTPDGRVINYTYDNGNRLSQIVTNEGTYQFTNDLAGRRTGLTYPNGVTTTYTYNPASYLTNLLARKSQSTVNSFSYTHDAVGNRLSMTDQQGLHTYQYDPTYQLLQAVHPSIPNEQFSYDPVGNRTNAVFDEVGGVKQNTNYTYDFENKLIRLQYPGMDAQYKYDPFGRRIEKNVNGQITRYVYDGNNMVGEYEGSGAVKSKYLFNLAIDDPLSIEQASSVYYYHKDGLGSVTELSDASGVVAKTYRYNSFGEIYAQSGSLVQPFTFTGREYDSESGLYYYRARYYDPSAGIFIGKDPIGFEGGDGNLFRYVGNNLRNWIDPFGLYTEIFIWQPVGWGQSSFGHVSTNINGTTYSFSPAGMTIEPTSTYIARPGNASRGAVGSVLNLTPAQEGRLQACLGGNQGSYSSTSNNCGSPVQNCLNQLQLGTAFSNLLPVSFGNSLMNSGLVTQYNFYYPTTPATGTSAPWAR